MLNTRKQQTPTARILLRIPMISVKNILKLKAKSFQDLKKEKQQQKTNHKKTFLCPWHPFKGFLWKRVSRWERRLSERIGKPPVSCASRSTMRKKAPFARRLGRQPGRARGAPGCSKERNFKVFFTIFIGFKEQKA